MKLNRFSSPFLPTFTIVASNLMSLSILIQEGYRRIVSNLLERNLILCIAVPLEKLFVNPAVHIQINRGFLFFTINHLFDEFFCYTCNGKFRKFIIDICETILFFR